MTRREYVDREGRTLDQYIVDQVRIAVMADQRTVRQIARAAGIGHMTLYRCLNEQRVFRVDELSRIAYVLDISPGDLVAGFEPV